MLSICWMHQLAGAKEKLQLLQLAFSAIQNEHSVMGDKLKKKKHKEGAIMQR